MAAPFRVGQSAQRDMACSGLGASDPRRPAKVTNMRKGFGRQGTSLIEVLTVMVVLLIGIFSVVRLFPPGFLITRQTEETTFAARLATAEIERFQNGAANLMDAIVPGFPDLTTGAFTFDPDATPDDLSDARNVPSGVDPYYVSDVNRMRRVIGETVRVPLVSPTGSRGAGSAEGERGSIYMLSLGPSVMIPDGAGRFLNLRVYGAPLRRVSGLEAENPDSARFLRSPAQYAIDYGQTEGDDQGVTQIAFYPMPYPRRFRIQYDYLDPSTGETNTRIIDFPSDSDTRFADHMIPAYYEGWIALDSSQGYDPYVVPDSETVSRQFRQLARGDLWGFQQAAPTNDPYEFKVLSDNIGPFANVGVLALNPLGRDYMEYSTYGLVPLTARIDYDVLDWRILREERAMPAAAPYTVRMSLKNLKRLGDMEEDQTAYQGLFRVAGSPDFLVYDTTSGMVVPPSEYRVDYKEGLVVFSDAFGAANAAGTFRFLYKAHGEWAVQVQKATSTYRRNRASQTGYDDYYLGYRYNADLGRDVPCIYFSLSEAGKTVSVRELTYVVATGSPVQVKTVRNVTFKINDNPANFVSLAGRTLTYADVASRERFQDALYWPTGPTGAYPYPVEPIVGMQGLSFRARVVWSGGASVRQTATGNVLRTRWRKVDLDTILTRAGN